MSVEGVMVSYNYSDNEEQANIVTVAASGIKFSDRWVLTHGSILSPLKQAQVILHNKGRSILNDQFYYGLPEIYVTCEKKRNPTEERYEEIANLSRSRSDPDTDMDHHSYQVRVLTGRICHVWQCPILDRCVDDVLYSWTIGHRDGGMEQQTQLGKALFSVFVLVDLESDDRGFKTLRPLSELYDLVQPPPDRGAALEVHSTPFGCEVFLNAVTRGAVCGAVGRRPALILTDASTSLGSEGGPVFTHGHSGSLIGVVVCSVCWWRGEWVGLTLCAPLRSVLAAKLKLHVSPPAPKQPTPTLYTSVLGRIDGGVALVRCGAAWGAGVWLRPGLLATCAHVVSAHERYKISVYCQGVKETAIVRYKTRDDKAYDLALLYTNPERWTHVTKAVFCTEPVKKGDPVLAAGFPYFNENNLEHLVPMVTSGHVTNASPTMLQTSCCVQSGFSGGAIYRIVGGTAQVAGVIVCNAKTATASYPYVNMAVPAAAFMHRFMKFADDKDESGLKELEHKKEMVQAQWRLLPYRSKI